jgi:DNA repair photolyase
MNIENMESIPTIPAKTIVNKVGTSAGWFDVLYNMNIYRGCSHGCIYCDSRSDCYRNFDFDTVKVKENALQIIRDELRRKVKTGIISTGAMSDPYNPVEEKLKLTRNALELMNAFGFGVSLCTKSALIARDVDVLCDIKRFSPVLVKFSITAAKDELCKKIEPFVSTTSQRFEALAKLSEKGIYSGVWINPVLPFLTDTEENIVSIVRMAKEAGAKFVFTFFSMTTRAGNREYYYEQLDKAGFSDVKNKHIKRFGSRYENSSPNAKKLWKVFSAECERLGLLYDMRAITAHYTMGYGSKQLILNGL